MVRNIIYAMLGAVLPLIYSALIGEIPSFPLAEAGFVDLILWLVGYVIGGWNVAKARLKYLKDQGVNVNELL